MVKNIAFITKHFELSEGYFYLQLLEHYTLSLFLCVAIKCVVRKLATKHWILFATFFVNLRSPLKRFFSLGLIETSKGVSWPGWAVAGTNNDAPHEAYV